MYWHCEICDNMMIAKIDISSLNSRNSFVNSIIRRLIIPTPLPNKNDDVIRKYLIIYNKNHQKFQIVLLLKILTPSNQIKCIRIQSSSYRYK